MQLSFFSGIKTYLRDLIHDQTSLTPQSPKTIQNFSILSNSESISQGVGIQKIPNSKQKPKIPISDHLFKLRNSVTGEDINLQQEASPSFGLRLSELLESQLYNEALDHIERQNEVLSKALREAAQNNQPDLCRLLLSKDHYGDLRANSNSFNQQQMTALHIAAVNNFFQVCQVLINFGDQTLIDPLNAQKKTPLHLACETGSYETCKKLLKYEAQIDILDIEGKTPFFYAFMSQEKRLMRLVMKKYPEFKIGEEESQEIGCRASTTDESKQSPFLQSPQRVEIVNSEIGSKLTPIDFSPIKALGKGSFGSVYLVQKNDTQEYFAMKILQKEFIYSKNIVKYAMTQRNVLSYVKHPFIVNLKYAFQTQNKLFLILQYCSGGDMGKLLSRQKRLPEKLARIYLAEILLALQELHNKDIIYRDLKPDNVVLDNQGHAVLTDFGLSKQGIINQYQSKSFCGSVAYLAPEVLKRTGHGKSVDWYLLGVLLYQMLVGVPPYFSSSRTQLFQNIKRAKLRIPTQLGKQARDLIIRLLNRNPKKRLGAENDAADIKKHPFFKGINWKQALNRKLKPPKPQAVEIEGQLPMERIVNISSLFETGKYHFSNWTFVEEGSSN